MEGRKAKVSESWATIFLNWSRTVILAEFVGRLGGLMGL